jgi:hypothetical protein
LVLCLYSLFICSKQNIIFSTTSTPLAARDWIDKNIPENTKILVEGYPGAQSERRICPLRDNYENMTRFAEEIEKESPFAAKYVRKKALFEDGRQYDLKIIRPKSNWISIKEAKKEGIQYAIIAKEHFSLDHLESKNPVHYSRGKFYENISNANNTNLMKKFSPNLKSDDDATPRQYHLELYKLK